ncbi:carbohydrate ABC transporter permease [Candidatus Caldatribacterium sp.]|uniref:carbohydrate ABC transporter permease n=1 Tax=Candidatus Caldatribacterium sp. TaxID=2282143 RepID=UPI0038433E8D|nr:sugar ABC transporter permease [Candidatus Caldatribacterium sp.]
MKAMRVAYLFLLPAFLYVLVFGLYPLLYNVSLSLRDVTFISYVQGTARFVGLGNYEELLRDAIFRRTFSNTLLFTGLSLFFQFTIGFLLALLFSRSFPLKGLLQSLLMVPWVLPIIVSGSFFRWFFSDNGMLNGFLTAFGIATRPIPWITSSHLPILSVTMANIWLGIPFNFVLLYTGLQGIPEELLESAAIDGATGWQKVVYIITPLLRPVILATLTLGCIFTVKVFDLVWIITQGGPGDVSHLFSTLSYSLAFNKLHFGKASAVLVVMLLVVAVLTVFLNLFQKEA